MGNITANKFLKNMYGVSNYEPEYLNAFGDFLDKINPITVTKDIISGVKSSTDALYRINNVYIPKLKSYDNSIPDKLTEYEKLEAEVERLNEDPSIVKEISISSSWSSAYGNAFVNHINGWINYGNTNKWWAAGTPNEKIIYDALWQTWQQLKASTGQEIKSIGLKYSEHKPYANDVLNFERFCNYIGQAGLLPKFKVKGSYTNLDLSERKAELKYRELLNEETDYDNTLASAKELASQYKLVDLRLDLYENRKARKERRENRRNKRKEKRTARKRVNAIINELETKHNPLELKYKTAIESSLARMKYYADRNLPTEQEYFIKHEQIVSENELNLEKLQVNIIDQLESELKTYADKYNFAERKMDKYYRQEARKTYRAEKKALKNTYKSLYGKGWRDESNWNNIKTDLQQERDDILNKYAGGARKISNKAKTTIFTPIRLAFLGLLVINAFDITKRLLFMKKNAPDIYDNLRYKWRKLGGNRQEFDKVIENNGNKKAFPPFGHKLSIKFNATGVEEVAAEVTTASPFLASVKTSFASMSTWIAANPDKFLLLAEYGLQKIDSVTGDDESEKKLTDEYIRYATSLINSLTELSEQQKIDAINYINQGKSLDEALELVGVSLTENENIEKEPDLDMGIGIGGWVTIGLLGAIAIGTILFLSFSKKAK